MSKTNKHFRLELDRKLNPWLKFEPNFLTWLPNGKSKRPQFISVLFSLFIQFSAIEIRRAFSHAKLMIRWLQWMEKRWDARARWWAIAIFQLTELNIKANPPCFWCARALGRAKWRHKLFTERMRNANVRNHLKEAKHKRKLKEEKIKASSLGRYLIVIFSFVALLVLLAKRLSISFPFSNCTRDKWEWLLIAIFFAPLILLPKVPVTSPLPLEKSYTKWSST